MSVTNWQFTYRDFDGQVKSSTAKVYEEREGEFYAVGENGCSKTYTSVMYWKPIKAALQSLIGEDRPLQTYSEVK